MSTLSASPSSELELCVDVPAAAMPDTPAEPLSSSPPRASSRGRRWFAGFSVALVLIVTSIAVYRWWQHSRSHVRTDNAYVTGHIHPISSRVPGTITEVLVNDNESVQEGMPLVKVDARDFQLRADQARTQVSQAQAQLAQSDALIQQAQAQLAQAQARSKKAHSELERATLDFDRAQHLTEDGRFAAISKQEYDALKAARDVAQASFQLTDAELQSAQAALLAAQANRSSAEAQRGTAQLQLREAELQLSYTVVVAPVSGRIGRKAVEVGQHVQPGQALAAIVEERPWVVANLKETQLAHLRQGQKVSIRVDAIPGHSFLGRVESLAPASGAQFALLPPDNATGNFTKIVQRVPVKITFDPASFCHFAEKLVPGLSAVVEVEVEPDKL